MTQGIVTGLFIHPLKGARPVSLTQAPVEPRGLAGDRRWMLVDAAGRFVSQREDGRLAMISAEVCNGGLRLSWPGGKMTVAPPLPAAPRFAAVIWRDSLQLPMVDAPGLSAFLDFGVRLAHLPEDCIRHANPAWAGPDAPVSLADAHPVLIATTGSLAALGAAAGANLPMSRFRPNIVIDAPAWSETRWRRLRIGAVELELVKPSDRCIVTTTDQLSGERMGKEPLASLARIRRSADPRIQGVLFGENAVPRRTGVIKLGDAVSVLESGAPWPIHETGY